MSKNTPPSKNSIDGIDVNDSSRSELIDAIDILKEEIERLNLKINEQEQMLQQQKLSEKEEFDGSDDIEILKEMIISQRKALNEKDGKLESIKENIRLLDEYKKEIEELTTFKSQISDAKSTIERLNNELNMHKVNEENAKELIIKLNEEKKEFEENEKESLHFIEELSEKNERYKNKVKILEQKLENIEKASSDEKRHLINDYESENERFYKDKIKQLQDKLDNVKKIAIEEASEFDDEKENLINDYEVKVKILEDKIENMENSFNKVKTSLEDENNKYKKKIVELQKDMQRLIKKGDQGAIHSINKLNLEDGTTLDLTNELVPETDGKGKPKTLTEREELYAKQENLNDQVISIGQPYSESINLSRTNEEIVPNETITKNEPFIDSVRKCPKCGNQRKSLIREELDKTNIILAYPRMYGKKYVCGAFGCGCNWRIKNKKIEIL